MISIVSPAYNESENIPILYNKIKEVLKDIDWELLIVNDGSTDDTEKVVEAIHAQDKRIKYISLSRNFGHQNAILAGLTFAKGDAIIIMDADLQDPPEVIPEMIQKWQEGFDTVHAIRKEREDPFLKKTLAKIFYKLFAIIAIKIPQDAGDFCLISKRVKDIIVSLPESAKFLRALRTWCGFPQTHIFYERPQRMKGKPKYNIISSTILAINGILGFSFFPLRIIFFLGLFVFFLSAILILWALIQHFIGNTIPGWTSTIIVILFLGSIQLLCLSIIGEYLGRTYEEVKKRPTFIVEKKIGID